MGHFSEEKPLDMGPFVQNVQHFGCLPSKIFTEHPKIVKNRPIFQEKSLEMGTFLAKKTLRNG